MNPLHLRPKYLCLYIVPLARTVQTTARINTHTGHYCLSDTDIELGQFSNRPLSVILSIHTIPVT